MYSKSMNIWKSIHYLSFSFILLAFDEVRAFLGFQSAEDMAMQVFMAPWLIFVVVDRIVNGKLTMFPWQRKDTDKKVVNDERDSF